MDNLFSVPVITESIEELEKFPVTLRLETDKELRLEAPLTDNRPLTDKLVFTNASPVTLRLDTDKVLRLETPLTDNRPLTDKLVFTNAFL